MPVDTSMYNSIPAPKTGMENLAQMAGVANAMQQNQALRNKNVQSGIDAQETQNLQPVLRNVNSYTDARGNIDFNKLVPMVMSVSPKNGASVLANMATAQQQRTVAQNAISGQSSDALVRSANAIHSLDPDTVTSKDLEDTANALNQNFTSANAQSATSQVFGNVAKVISSTKPGDPLRATALHHAAMMYLPIETQQGINTPNAVQMGNGQQTWLQNTKPGVTGIPQNSMIPNTAVQQQLPPATPVMQGNTPGYIGPQMGGISPGGQQQQSGFVPSGLPAGTQKNIDDNFKQMNDHFAGLQDQSQGTALVQSLKGNIQQLANKAITGTESDKLAYANGLLAALPGHGHADDLKTATDLLDKNMVQLNLSTPAATDAARALITLARPNETMSAEAIKEATGQVASQVEANMAIRNHLAGYKYANNGQGNSVAYQQERQAIEKVADPRIWQYLDLGKGSPEARAFMNKLSAADKDPRNKNGLLYKAHQAEQMGLISGGK